MKVGKGFTSGCGSCESGYGGGWRGDCRWSQ